MSNNPFLDLLREEYTKGGIFTLETAAQSLLDTEDEDKTMTIREIASVLTEMAGAFRLAERVTRR